MTVFGLWSSQTFHTAIDLFGVEHPPKEYRAGLFPGTSHGIVRPPQDTLTFSGNHKKKKKKPFKGYQPVQPFKPRQSGKGRILTFPRIVVFLMALVLGIFSPIIRNLAVDLDLPVVDDVVAGLLADDENGRAVSQFGDTALANESRSTQTLSDPIRNRLNNAQVVSVIEEVALRFPELSADTLGLIIILESHGNPQAYNPNLGRGGLLPQGTVNNGLSVEHQGEQLVRYFQELQARLGGNGQLPSDPAVLYALILNPSLPVYGDEPMVPEMSVFPSGSFPNYAPYEMLTVGQLHEDLLNLKRELGLEPYPLDNQTP